MRVLISNTESIYPGGCVARRAIVRRDWILLPGPGHAAACLHDANGAAADFALTAVPGAWPPIRSSDDRPRQPYGNPLFNRAGEISIRPLRPLCLERLKAALGLLGAGAAG